eukprot:7598872-Alexandrium_andersonii.AAC.1
MESGRAKDPCAAWAEAVATTQGRKGQRTAHSADALVPVLLRYVAFRGATTSGVEQSFSTQSQLLRPCRANHCTEWLENDEFKIAADLSKDQYDNTIQAAQSIWRKYFGKPRTTKREKRRFDVGKKRKAGWGEGARLWATAGTQ